MVKTASRVSKDHTFLTVASKFQPKAKIFFSFTVAYVVFGTKCYVVESVLS